MKHWDKPEKATSEFDLIVSYTAIFSRLCKLNTDKLEILQYYN